MLMIKNIQFRHINSTFQEQLKERYSRNSARQSVICVGRQIKKMNKEDYEKLMHETITKTYEKTNEFKVKTINKSAKKIANRLDLEDRIETLQENENYITIKDHKDNFPYKTNSPF